MGGYPVYKKVRRNAFKKRCQRFWGCGIQYLCTVLAFQLLLGLFQRHAGYDKVYDLA